MVVCCSVDFGRQIWSPKRSRAILYPVCLRVHTVYMHTEGLISVHVTKIVIHSSIHLQYPVYPRSLWIQSLSQEHCVWGRNTPQMGCRETCSHIHTWGLIYHNQSTYWHIFRWWEEIGGNPRKHRENMWNSKQIVPEHGIKPTVLDTEMLVAAVPCHIPNLLDCQKYKSRFILAEFYIL